MKKRKPTPTPTPTPAPAPEPPPPPADGRLLPAVLTQPVGKPPKPLTRKELEDALVARERARRQAQNQIRVDQRKLALDAFSAAWRAQLAARLTDPSFVATAAESYRDGDHVKTTEKRMTVLFTLSGADFPSAEWAAVCRVPETYGVGTYWEKDFRAELRAKFNAPRSERVAALLADPAACAALDKVLTQLTTTPAGSIPV